MFDFCCNVAARLSVQGWGLTLKSRKYLVSTKVNYPLLTLTTAQPPVYRIFRLGVITRGKHC